MFASGVTEAYDLTGPSTHVVRRFRVVRRMWCLIAVVFALLLVWFIDLALTPGDLHDATQKVVIAVIGSGTLFITGLSAFAIWKSGPGATAVLIDDRGIQFTWTSGTMDLVKWDNMGDGLVLLDYSVNSALSRRTQYLWEVRRWKRPATRLTRDAFEAIVRGATQRGLSLQSAVPRTTLWGWARCRVVRITPQHASPRS